MTEKEASLGVMIGAILGACALWIDGKDGGIYLISCMVIIYMIYLAKAKK